MGPSNKKRVPAECYVVAIAPGSPLFERVYGSDFDRMARTFPQESCRRSSKASASTVRLQVTSDHLPMAIHSQGLDCPMAKQAHQGMGSTMTALDFQWQSGHGHEGECEGKWTYSILDFLEFRATTLEPVVPFCIIDVRRPETAERTSINDQVCTTIQRAPEDWRQLLLWGDERVVQVD